MPSYNNTPAKNEESPLKQYCDNFDIQHIDWTGQDYKKYALSVPAQQLTQMWVDDMKWREQHGMHNIISVWGLGGTGKSIPLYMVAIWLGKIYKNSFKPENVLYSMDEMEQKLTDPKLRRETIIKDEETSSEEYGMMAGLISDFVKDLEMQLRKHQINLLYASVRKEDRANFYVCETMNILYDSNGKPQTFLWMLTSPRYTNKSEFVWRGYLAIPMPSDADLKAYEERKENHLKNLKARYGNNIEPIMIKAIELYKSELKNELIAKTREGIIRPIQDVLMQAIIAKKIGSHRYTNKGYDTLRAKICQLINREYEGENTATLERIKENKEKLKLEKKELIERQIEERRKIHEEKMQAFNLKLEEDKKRNHLKQQALDLQRQAEENKRLSLELKAQNVKENLKPKIEEKKKQLQSEGNPAHYFAEDLVK